MKHSRNNYVVSDDFMDIILAVNNGYGSNVSGRGVRRLIYVNNDRTADPDMVVMYVVFMGNDEGYPALLDSNEFPHVMGHIGTWTRKVNDPLSDQEIMHLTADIDPNITIWNRMLWERVDKCVIIHQANNHLDCLNAIYAKSGDAFYQINRTKLYLDKLRE